MKYTLAAALLLTLAGANPAGAGSVTPEQLTRVLTLDVYAMDVLVHACDITEAEQDIFLRALNGTVSQFNLDKAKIFRDARRMVDDLKTRVDARSEEYRAFIRQKGKCSTIAMIIEKSNKANALIGD